MKNLSLESIGESLVTIVVEKNKLYGNSTVKSGRILAELYPNGIPVNCMEDALLIVRVLDKLSRLAQRANPNRPEEGESPWFDIAGYGLLGYKKDQSEVLSKPVEPAPNSSSTVPLIQGLCPPSPRPTKWSF